MELEDVCVPLGLRHVSILDLKVITIRHRCIEVQHRQIAQNVWDTYHGFTGPTTDRH
jgi:hypothetical protein